MNKPVSFWADYMPFPRSKVPADRKWYAEATTKYPEHEWWWYRKDPFIIGLQHPSRQWEISVFLIACNNAYTVHAVWDIQAYRLRELLWALKNPEELPLYINEPILQPLIEEYFRTI